MSELYLDESLAKFAKGKPKEKINGGNAILYYRVSTKEQEDNCSLNTQLKACYRYAESKGFSILEEFGGEFESAKTDKERKKLNSMLEYVRKNRKLNLKALIVYNGSRLSRAGTTRIMDELESLGIYIHSVQTQLSTDTATGRFTFISELNNANFDNQIKSQTTKDNIRQALRKGRWVNIPPMGYDMKTTKKTQEITINETGELLRQAFHWKANDGLNNHEIVRKLQARGVKIYMQRLTDIFSNPFYCGWMRHNCLDGELVKGNHPPLVSVETFKKVNNIIDKTHQSGYECKRSNEYVPLLTTLKCPKCGGNVTYSESTKMRNKYGKTGYFYYSCSRNGCRFNVRELKAHNAFQKLLESVSLTDQLKDALVYQLTKLVEHYTKDSRAELVKLRGEITELESQIEDMETKWALEPDTKRQNILLRIIKKKEEELEITKEETKGYSNEILNLDEVIEFALNTYSNSLNIWQKSDLTRRQLLQKTIFPAGITYDKENEECRTCEINPLFEVMRSFPDDYNDVKKRGLTIFTVNPLLCPEQESNLHIVTDTRP